MKKKKIILFLSLSLVFFITVIALLFLVEIIYLRPLLRKPSQKKISGTESASKTLTGSVEQKSLLPVRNDDMEVRDYIKNICNCFTFDFLKEVEFSEENFDETGKIKQEVSTRKIPVVQVPDSIKAIAGLAENCSYTDRIKAANKLSKNLSDTEVKALLYFLHKRLEDDVLGLLELNAVKNQVTNTLVEQNLYPQDMGSHLIAMYYDELLDDVWRDYCIQFLGQCYSRIPEKKERESVALLFSDALKEKKKSFAGTALIAMKNLADNPDFYFSKAEISEFAYNLTADEGTADLVKITSFQVCAVLRNRKALKLARELTERKKSYIPLKVSAIAALGILGDRSDIPVLKKCEKSSDTRLRTASKSAIRKIDDR